MQLQKVDFLPSAQGLLDTLKIKFHLYPRSRAGRQVDDRALPGVPKPTAEGNPETGVRPERPERRGQDHGAAVRGALAGVCRLLGKEEVVGAQESQEGLQGGPR